MKTKAKENKTINHHKNKSFSYKLKKWFSKTKKSLMGNNKSDDFSLVEVILIIIISILFGIVVGYIITYSNSPFRRSNHTGLQEITNTYQDIIDNYYGELDEEKLVNSAIKGMVDSLDDPYSSYMNESATNQFNETVDGSFVGIGAVIMFSEGSNRIIEVYEDSPSAKAGIQVDDSIVQVDGVDVTSLVGEELVKLIRGEKGTKVSITVRRGEEEFTYTVKRDTVDYVLVQDEVFEYDGKKVGYIKIESFASNTYEQFKKSLLKLEKEKISSLILDVRDNPGGHLLQTKQILSMFFSKKTVLFQIESKQKKQKVKSLSDEVRDYPVAVLINSSSASASEVVASCFQDNYKDALIVGITSYGKGTVQQSQSLKNGTSIKYTTQKWLTSKGKWLNNTGVTPDVEVQLSESYYQNPVHEEDNQLQEAIQRIVEKVKNKES